MSRENKIRQAGRTRRNSIRNGKNGFTMVELVVVLVVIALLAAVTIPVMFGFIDSAREKEYVVDAEAALTATQAALTEIYNDGGNRLIPDRRLKAKETAGAEDGSEFTVWTKGQLVDGKTAAIEDNMASYTVAYAKYVAADGKVVIFSDDEWTLYDNESAAKAGDSPALNSEGNVTGSTSGNVILVWGWENRYAGLSGRELSAKLDTAYAPDTEFNGRQEWNPDDEVPSVITVVFKVLQNEEETDKPLVCLLDGEDTLLNYTQLDENGKTFYTFTCLYDMDEGFNADFNKINKVKIAKKYESKFKWKYNQGGINIEADGEFKNLESQIKDSAAAIIGSQENPEIVLTAEMNPRQLPVTALFTALHDYSLSVEVRDSYTNSVNYTVGLSDDNTITGVNLAELITVKSAATGDTNNSVAQHDGLWREKISNNSMADGSSLASVDMRIRQYLLECKQDFMSSNRPSYMTDSEVAQITSQYKIEFKAAADIYKSVYIEQRMRNEAGIYTYNPPAQLVFFNDCAPEVPPLGKDNQYVVTFKKNELSDNVLFANGAAISESYSFKAASIDFDNIKGNIRRWDLSKCNKFGSIASIGSKPEIEDMYGDPTQKVLAKLTDLYKKCSSKDNVGDSLWLEVEMSSKSTAALAYNYYDTSNNWRNKPALAKTRMAGLVDNINKVIRVEYIKKDQRQQYGYYTEGMFYKEVLLSDTELETTATSAGDRLIPENGRIDEENIVRGDGLASDNKVTPPDENDEGACLDYVVAFSVRNGNNYNIYVFSENDSDTIVVRNSLQEMFSGYSSMTYNDFVSSLDTSEAYRLKKMFLNCSSLTELNLGNLNLYNTRDVSEIFHNCSKLETLYYNSDTFNTSNTWYFDQMFAGCAKLNPAPEIDISSAVDIHLMFTGCKSLKKVVIKAESIYNFEGALAGTYLGRENKNDAPNLSGMIGNKAISGVFSDCNGLEEIEILGPKPEDDKRLSFINITDLTYMFRSGYTYKDNNNNTRVNRFQNVKKVTIKNIGIPNMTSTDELFKDYISLGSISIEDFYAPKTVSMNGMFSGCSNGEFSKIDLSGFRTGTITTLNSTFKNCSHLQEIKLGTEEKQFDTREATDMESLFEGCSALTKVILNQKPEEQAEKKIELHIDSAESIENMFNGCQLLTEIRLIGKDGATSPLSNVSGIFSGCQELTTVQISDIKAEQLTSLSALFKGCEKLNSVDFGSFSTGNLLDTSEMFYGCKLFEGYGEGYNLGDEFSTALVKDFSYMFCNCEALNSGFLTQIDTTSAIDMTGMFKGCSNENFTSTPDGGLHINDVERIKELFNGCANLRYVKLIGNGDSPLDDISGLFGECKELISVEISNIKAPQLTSFNGLFKGCMKLETVKLSGLETGTLTDTSEMFSGCENLAGLGEGFDLGDFDTSNVINMSRMFYDCKEITSDVLDGISTDSTQDMSYMFFNCESLSSNVFDKISTGSVQDMSYMFYGCTGLETDQKAISLRIDSAIDMKNMFNGCTSLSKITLKGLNNTSNLTNPNTIGVFTGTDLTEITISDITFSQLNPITGFIAGSKSGVTKIVLDDVQASAVTSFDFLFQNYTALCNVDLSTFTPGSVTSAASMFENCTSLRGNDVTLENKTYQFKLNGTTFGSVTNVGSMFRGCSKLRNLPSGLVTSNVVGGGKESDIDGFFSTFRECTDLGIDSTKDTPIAINISKANNIMFMFKDCTNLKALKLYGNGVNQTTGTKFNSWTIQKEMFGNCGNLISLAYEGLYFESLRDNGVTVNGKTYSGITKILGGKNAQLQYVTLRNLRFAQLSDSKDCTRSKAFIFCTAPEANLVFDEVHGDKK